MRPPTRVSITPPMPAVVIDTREQLPYSFASVLSPDGPAPRVATLRSGDYSLAGHVGEVAVERKSHADLLGTLTAGRDRFERELLRLSGYHHAAIVVEAEWSTILLPQPHSKLTPRTILRSVLAWQNRYPRCHWHFVPGREFGEVLTYRILERFHKDHQHEASQYVL